MASKGSAQTDSTKNVTKKHLVERIAAETGLPRCTVQRVVQGVLDQLVHSIRDGKRVELRDFGVFEVKERAARTAQNPKTLEPVPVPPKLAVRFKAGRLMKEALAAQSKSATAKASGRQHRDSKQEQPLVEVPGREPVPAGAGRD